MSPTIARKRWERILSALGTALLASCEGGVPNSETGSRIALSVAPLNLPGIDEACYSIEIANNASGSGLVFSEANICSTKYGDGKGAITFVGACDASADADPAAGIQNRVELQLTSLSSNTGDLTAPADYINPCGNEQCVQFVTCTENIDTAVTFNLTVLRSADQGFFDIGVSFSDVFCSAKVDCPSQLVFNDAGVRGPTAVVAFACTAGDAGPTHMYLDDIAFAGLTYDVDAPKGNNDVNGATAGGRYVIYKDQEELPGYTKYFWNIAIDITGKTGTIVTRASASGTPLVGNTTPAATRYPVIDFNVPVNSGVCSANPLDGPGSGVTTSYTPLSSTSTFTSNYGDQLGPITDGLLLRLEASNIASYPGTGSTWFDLTGNGNNTNLSGGASFVAEHGGGLSFDGLNDYGQYQLAFPQSITVTTIGRSNTALWTNYAGLGAARGMNGFIIHNDMGLRSVNFYFMSQSAGYIGIGSFSLDDITRTSSYTMSTNGSNLHKFYLNGVLKGTSTTPITRSTSPAVIPGKLGMDDASGRYNNVTLYQHLVYNRQLSDAEVLQNFNAIKSQFGL